MFYFHNVCLNKRNTYFITLPSPCSPTIFCMGLSHTSNCHNWRWSIDAPAAQAQPYLAGKMWFIHCGVYKGDVWRKCWYLHFRYLFDMLLQFCRYNTVKISVHEMQFNYSITKHSVSCLSLWCIIMYNSMYNIKNAFNKL